MPASLFGMPMGRCHACALVESAAEAEQLLAPFIREGAKAHEQLWGFAGRNTLSTVRSRLQAFGIDVAGDEITGQLRLVPWTGLAPDPAELCDGRRVTDALGRLLPGGEPDAPGARVVTHMDWLVGACPNHGCIHDMERGMDALSQSRGLPVVCVYDLNRLSGPLLLDVLSSHPVTVVRGALARSPYYAEPP